MANFKDQSRGQWNSGKEPVNTEQLKFGALRRIADATEVMAKNYVALQNERDKYKRYYDEQMKSNERMARRISALQGVITKLKKKAR